MTTGTGFDLVRIAFRGSAVRDFSALHRAERWCRALGLSVGSLQGPAPRGVMIGDYDVAKWRNLNAAERAGLDGWLTAPHGFRFGPVFLDLKPAAAARLGLGARGRFLLPNGEYLAGHPAGRVGLIAHGVRKRKGLRHG